METKKCPHCGRTLPLTEFYKMSSSRDGLQCWCKECMNNRIPTADRTKTGRCRIDLEPYKSDILVYRRTHTILQTTKWLEKNYHLKMARETLGGRLRVWEDESRRTQDTAPVIQPQPEIKPVTLADFDDAALITELRKRGYRVYYDRFIKSKWGNHYKRRMVEAVGNTDNK